MKVSILRQSSLSSTKSLFFISVSLTHDLDDTVRYRYSGDSGLVRRGFKLGKSVTNRANVRKSGLFIVTSVTALATASRQCNQLARAINEKNLGFSEILCRRVRTYCHSAMSTDSPDLRKWRQTTHVALR
jgi:hypothetical protein